MVNGKEIPSLTPRPTPEVVKLSGRLHAFFIREKLDAGAIMVLLVNTMAERLWLDRIEVDKVPAVLDQTREYTEQIYRCILLGQGGPRP